MVVHSREDGTESFSWGDSVVVQPGTVTTAVDSLSEYSSDTLVCLPTAGSTNALFDCADSPDDETIQAIAIRRADSLTRIVRSTLTHGPCGEVTERVHSEGSIPFGMSCGSGGGVGSSNTWTLSNDTGASILEGLFTSTGAVYHVNPLEQGGYVLGYASASNDPEGLTGLLKEHLALSRLHLLMSGGALTITKAAGSGSSSFELTSDHAFGAAAWTVANVTAALDDAVGAIKAAYGANVFVAELSKITGILASCPVELIVSGADALAGCIKDGTMSILEKIYQGMDGRTREAKTVKSALIVGRTVFKYGALIDNAIASAIVSLAAEIGEGTLRLRFDLPAAPQDAGAGHGGSNPAGGVDGTITNDSGEEGNVLVKLQGDSQIYWIEPRTAMAHGVESTQDYFCFAHRYPLRDQLPPRAADRLLAG